MKTFYEFYAKMEEDMAQQPAPVQGGATSAPVPPPDMNLMNGLKMLSQVKDPKAAGLISQFQKQLQGLGIQMPGQPAMPAKPAVPGQVPQPQTNAAPQQPHM